MAAKDRMAVLTQMMDQGVIPVFYHPDLNVFDANAAVNLKLREQGALLKEDRISHEYPHCWRCKNPVIFRSTEQWFISMEKNELRIKALEVIKKVCLDSELGEGPHLRSDREPSLLVHLPRERGAFL